MRIALNLKNKQDRYKDLKQLICPSNVHVIKTTERGHAEVYFNDA